MFYRATSTVERVIKGIAEFLEHTPMKEWDKESKVFHEWNFLRTEIEENYNKAKDKIFWITKAKDFIYIKISEDYELVVNLNWDLTGLNRALKSYEIRVRESVTWGFEDYEYPSYFKSTYEAEKANLVMSGLLTDLGKAIHMSKDDWKREEV